MAEGQDAAMTRRRARSGSVSLRKMSIKPGQPLLKARTRGPSVAGKGGGWTEHATAGT